MLSTKTKVIVGLLIATMLSIGFLLTPAIKNYENTCNNNIKNRPIITTEEAFKQALADNVGQIIVYGTIKTIDPITVPGFSGQYMAVNCVTETYMTHQKRQGNGKVFWNETYQSWDITDNTTQIATQAYFCGQLFSPEAFALGCPQPIGSVDSETIKQTYSVCSDNVSGTMFIDTNDFPEHMNKLIFDPDKTPEQAINYRTGHYLIIVFWLAWLLLAAILITWIILI